MFVDEPMSKVLFEYGIIELTTFAFSVAISAFVSPITVFPFIVNIPFTVDVVEIELLTVKSVFVAKLVEPRTVKFPLMVIFCPKVVLPERLEVPVTANVVSTFAELRVASPDVPKVPVTFAPTRVASILETLFA